MHTLFRCFEQRRLDKGQLMSLSTSGPAVVGCFEGTLWLSAPAVGDVLLSAGRSIRLTTGKRVVIQALEGSLVAVERARHGGFLRRLWSRLNPVAA